MRHYTFDKDENERRKWQNPEATLKDIELHPDLTFIDVGCGQGFFAIPAARIVGNKGRVYALDLDQKAITMLKQKAARENIKNIHPKVGAAEDTVFCQACADVVFYSIVLHDFNNPVRVLTNAKTMLKPTGRLVDLDWKKKPMHIGPPLQIRFSEEQAATLIEKAGFKIEQKKTSGPFHYVLVARP